MLGVSIGEKNKIETEVFSTLQMMKITMLVESSGFQSSFSCLSMLHIDLQGFLRQMPLLSPYLLLSFTYLSFSFTIMMINFLLFSHTQSLSTLVSYQNQVFRFFHIRKRKITEDSEYMAKKREKNYY